MAFRQSRLVRAKNERHVGEYGSLDAERAVQQYLFGSVRDVVCPANHVADAHVDVVDHNSQLIHGLTKFFIALARAQQHEVLDFVIGEFALAEHRVDEFGRPAGWHAKTNGGLNARRGWLAVSTRAAHDAAWPSRLRLIILRLNRMVAARVALCRAVAQERRAAGEQFLARSLVKLGTLRLVKRAFVPINSKPTQAIHNSLH